MEAVLVKVIADAYTRYSDTKVYSCDHIWSRVARRVSEVGTFNLTDATERSDHELYRNITFAYWPGLETSSWESAKPLHRSKNNMHVSSIRH